MTVRDRFDDREPQPGAALARVGTAVEAIERTLAVSSRDAGTGVRHFESRAGATGSHVDSDSSAFRRVARCVVDKIARECAECSTVAEHRGALVGIEPQL